MTYLKRHRLPIKNLIKELAEYQCFLKNQRKTVNRVGPKMINPEDAAYRHHNNRMLINKLHRLYDLLRFKFYDRTPEMALNRLGWDKRDFSLAVNSSGIELEINFIPILNDLEEVLHPEVAA